MKKIILKLRRWLWLLEMEPSPSLWLPVLVFLYLLGLVHLRPRQWGNLWLRQLNHRSYLAATRAAARNARMASWRAARRQSRRTRKRTRLANVTIALARKWRHCRRCCRVQRRRLQTHLCRWLLVNLLSLALWFLLLAVRLWFSRRS